MHFVDIRAESGKYLRGGGTGCNGIYINEETKSKRAVQFLAMISWI